VGNRDRSDQELMEAYLTGDESAFAQLYQRHSGKIYAFLRKKLDSREEVDEVFQKVFLKLHKTRKNYNSQYPLMQWMYVVAKTTLLDHFRLQSRQIETTDTPLEEMNSIEVSQTHTTETLIEGRDMSALEGLTTEQKQAIEMRIVDELSYDEIAKALNKSEVNVRQIISRALKRIRG
jgi:RNA polymerase sigma-70 factor (ECF subfamily)